MREKAVEQKEPETVHFRLFLLSLDVFLTQTMFLIIMPITYHLYDHSSSRSVKASTIVLLAT